MNGPLYPYQHGPHLCSEAPPPDWRTEQTLFDSDGDELPFGESSQPRKTSPDGRVCYSEKLTTVPGDQARDGPPLTQPDPPVKRQQDVPTRKSSKDRKQGSTTTRRADQDPKVQTLHKSADEKGIRDGSQVSSSRQTLHKQLKDLRMNDGTLNRGPILQQGPGRGRPRKGDIRFGEPTAYAGAKQEAQEKRFGT
jgi:hypothetical protein